MSDYQKLSSDLSRITEFLLSGNEKMTRQFMDRVQKLYSRLPGKIGEEALGVYLGKIVNLEGGTKAAAERAMTASMILLSSTYETRNSLVG